MNKVFQEDYFCWRKGEGGYLSQDFHSEEFEDELSQIQMIAIDIVEILQHIRDYLGFRLSIHTGYVHKSDDNLICENDYDDGELSEHYWGRAVKISTDSISDNQRAALLDELAKHFCNIAIGPNFIYIDLRTDKQRVWRMNG